MSVEIEVKITSSHIELFTIKQNPPLNTTLKVRKMSSRSSKESLRQEIKATKLSPGVIRRQNFIHKLYNL